MNTFRVLFFAAAAASVASACSSGGGSNAGPPQDAHAVHYSSAFDGRMGTSAAHIHVMPPRDSAAYAAAVAAEPAGMGGPKQAVPNVGPATPSPTPTPAPSATPTPTVPMTYAGGPIQPHPVVYTVWYGTGWNTPATGDPGGEKPFLKNFYKAASNSKWLNDVRQYTETDNAYPDNESPLLTGSWSDTTSPLSTSPSYFDMYAEALAAAAHWGDYSVNANYVILTPAGITPVDFETKYCGYHSAAYVESQNAWVAYTVIPYLGDNSTNTILHCGGYYFGNPTDAPAIVAGHELAEVITDPQPVGQPSDGYIAWGNLSGSGNSLTIAEVGDKCAWQNLEINPTIGDGTTYASQPLFNNGNLKCRQDPAEQF